MEFPIYKISISDFDFEKAEVDFIALVDKPAIERNFLAFDSNRKNFAIENEEERIVTGLALIADLPIYRRDKDGEYYTYFDAEVIKKIAQRFFRKQYNFNLNLNHNANTPAKDVYIFESWIVDREKGKTPMNEFSDVSNGSWIISAKIDNPDIWNAIKAGQFRGFSVEGLFNMERIGKVQPKAVDEDLTEEEFVEELKKLLQK